MGTAPQGPVDSSAESQPQPAPSTNVTESPTVDYSKHSDDDILDMDLSKGQPQEKSQDSPPAEEVTGEAVETAPEGEAEAEETNAEEEGKKAKPDAEEEDSEEEDSKEELEADSDLPIKEVPEPKELKEVFKAHPALRSVYFQHKAYQEQFGSVKEAREAMEIFPGGLEEMRTAFTELGELRQYRDAFMADTPDAPQQLAEFMHGANKDRYFALSQWMGENFLRGLHSRAKSTQDQEALEALEGVSEFAHSQGVAPRLLDIQEKPRESGARESALDTKEQEIKEREQNLNKQAQSEFDTRCNEGIVTGVMDAINKRIESLLDGQELPERALQRIAGDIYDEVHNTLKKNTVLSDQINDAIGKGDQGKDHSGRVITLVSSRYKGLIPATAAKVLKEWTGQILSTQGKVLEQRKQQAKVVDLGRGGEPEIKTGTSDLKPSQIDYSKTSDDDILDDKVTART